MSDKTESRLVGETSTTSDIQMIPLNGRKERETKLPLVRVKEEIEKADLKLNIKKRSQHPAPSLHGK